MSKEHAFPWLFKGAYAIYSGRRNHILFVDFEEILKLEVEDIDLDNEQVKLVLHYTKFAVPVLFPKKRNKIHESREEGWIKIGDRLLPSSTTSVLEREYEGIINMGTSVRKCIIQEWRPIKLPAGKKSNVSLLGCRVQLAYPIYENMGI